jgi:hypothetical protein
MILILAGAVAFLAWRLNKVNKSRNIVMNRYIEATNPNHLMYDPSGQAHPMWCPNCGRNL